jgi:hypothetical protein
MRSPLSLLLLAAAGVGLGTACKEVACDGRYALSARFENYDVEPVHLFLQSDGPSEANRVEAGQWRRDDWSAEFFDSVEAEDGGSDRCRTLEEGARETPQPWSFQAFRNDVVLGAATVEVTYDRVEKDPTVDVTVTWSGDSLTAALD